MPARKFIHCFDRSKIAPLRETSHLSSSLKITKRDAPEKPPQPPAPGFTIAPKVPPGRSYDDSDDEDDNDGIEGESDDDFNSFDSSTGTRSPHTTIPSSTSMANMPAVTHTTVTSSRTMSSLPTSTVPGSAAVPLPPVATNGASTSSGSSNPTVESSKSSPNIAAIVIASLLGAASIGAILYLLLRYCKPLKARISMLRARNGQRLSEEDGTTPRRAITEMSQTDTCLGAGNPRGCLPNAPSNEATLPAPPYVRSVSTNVPGIFIRSPQSSSRGIVQNADADNPFTDEASLSRSNSDGSMRSTADARLKTAGAGGLPTHNSDFTLADYMAARMSISARSHPGGLSNNPPTILGSDDGGDDDYNEERVKAQPSKTGGQLSLPNPSHPELSIPCAAQLKPISPLTPLPYFSTPSPRPESGSVITSPGSQYQPRIRKSITPSDSVSNAPYSPSPFPMELMPPTLPAGMNSRWSRNSSSVNGRSAGTADDTIAPPGVGQVAASPLRRVSSSSPRTSVAESNGEVLPTPVPHVASRRPSSSAPSSRSSRSSR
ncbi:hypothetical protein HRR83_000321 [Exophiala dermatitidis]|uniref:Uncharacterized protein n=1 Tax=Exophiala dermatitidis TaxID=5970 RepID=A0AAN6F1J5_EXODE|nr:hypothetical protein HRR73_002857 [Exophiala dermatitidis]KAJ4524696.1 hypothetical protein HRR75_000286 [Exophiala dermatitidis]KAJ4527569.1 hypothetical protein HRR74_000323 [Exophiala dermatitidis]KAJ4531143.1 hypothetical protein HRR76_008819 [Exophiala dermatitidis]KAJ4550007.1 hypothetical protein HRR78_004818 [Exophiala dermatitidis]